MCIKTLPLSFHKTLKIPSFSVLEITLLHYNFYFSIHVIDCFSIKMNISNGNALQQIGKYYKANALL